MSSFLAKTNAALQWMYGQAHCWGEQAMRCLSTKPGDMCVAVWERTDHARWHPHRAQGVDQENAQASA